MRSRHSAAPSPIAVQQYPDSGHPVMDSSPAPGATAELQSAVFEPTLLLKHGIRIETFIIQEALNFTIWLYGKARSITILDLPAGQDSVYQPNRPLGPVWQMPSARVIHDHSCIVASLLEMFNMAAVAPGRIPPDHAVAKDDISAWARLCESVTKMVSEMQDTEPTSGPGRLGNHTLYYHICAFLRVVLSTEQSAGGGIVGILGMLPFHSVHEKGTPDPEVKRARLFANLLFVFRAVVLVDVESTTVRTHGFIPANMVRVAVQQTMYGNSQSACRYMTKELETPVLQRGNDQWHFVGRWSADGDVFTIHDRVFPMDRVKRLGQGAVSVLFRHTAELMGCVGISHSQHASHVSRGNLVARWDPERPGDSIIRVGCSRCSNRDNMDTVQVTSHIHAEVTARMLEAQPDLTLKERLKKYLKMVEDFLQSFYTCLWLLSGEAPPAEQMAKIRWCNDSSGHRDILYDNGKIFVVFGKTQGHPSWFIALPHEVAQCLTSYMWQAHRVAARFAQDLDLAVRPNHFLFTDHILYQVSNGDRLTPLELGLLPMSTPHTAGYHEHDHFHVNRPISRNLCVLGDAEDLDHYDDQQPSLLLGMPAPGLSQPSPDEVSPHWSASYLCDLAIVVSSEHLCPKTGLRRWRAVSQAIASIKLGIPSSFGSADDRIDPSDERRRALQKNNSVISQRWHDWFSLPKSRDEEDSSPVSRHSCSYCDATQGQAHDVVGPVSASAIDCSATSETMSLGSPVTPTRNRVVMSSGRSTRYRSPSLADTMSSPPLRHSNATPSCSGGRGAGAGLADTTPSARMPRNRSGSVTPAKRPLDATVVPHTPSRTPVPPRNAAGVSLQRQVPSVQAFVPVMVSEAEGDRQQAQEMISCINNLREILRSSCLSCIRDSSRPMRGLYGCEGECSRSRNQEVHAVPSAEYMEREMKNNVIRNDKKQYGCCFNCYWPYCACHNWEIRGNDFNKFSKCGHSSCNQPMSPFSLLIALDNNSHREWRRGSGYPWGPGSGQLVDFRDDSCVDWLVAASRGGGLQLWNMWRLIMDIVYRRM